MLVGVLRGLLVVVFTIGGYLLLIAVLAIIQGQRDETRPAGAAVVLPAEGPVAGLVAARQARLDQALDLYRRGTVTRIIVVGEAAVGEDASAASGKTYLVEHGVPPEAVLLDEQGGTTLDGLRAASLIARERGIASMLLVSEPPHMLRALKIARDLGLNAYAAPTYMSPSSRSFTTEIGYIASEAWAYTVYLFVGR
jgi:uncharacterized SAM-binding protein YcdF (DUF218 family)